MALHVTLKRGENEPVVLITESGERIEIRYAHIPIGDHITIDITAPMSVEINNPSLVKKKGIEFESKAKLR